MRTTDLDAVVEIEQRSSPSPWPAQLFVEDLTRDWAFIDLARRRDASGRSRVVGFANYWLVHDELHLLNLATHPEHRRQGIATRLMRHLAEVARARACRYITLEVRRSNHAAQALYQAQSFQAVGVRARYYSDGEDAIVMACTMGPRPD